MECPGCQHSNPPDAKFCGECGTRLQSLRAASRTATPPTSIFCHECGQRLAGGPRSAPASPTRLATPESYTPTHLAEKILTSRSAMEGERKLVTVMFSDVSGFTAMSG